MRIPNGDYPLGSMRVPLGEDILGMHAATPAHMGSLDSGYPARPTSASWRDADGLSAALARNRDSELADILAAPGECHSLSLSCVGTTLAVHQKHGHSSTHRCCTPLSAHLTKSTCPGLLHHNALVNQGWITLTRLGIPMHS